MKNWGTVVLRGRLCMYPTTGPRVNKASWNEIMMSTYVIIPTDSFRRADSIEFLQPGIKGSEPTLIVFQRLMEITSSLGARGAGVGRTVNDGVPGNGKKKITFENLNLDKIRTNNPGYPSVKEEINKTR